MATWLLNMLWQAFSLLSPIYLAMEFCFWRSSVEQEMQDLHGVATLLTSLVMHGNYGKRADAVSSLVKHYTVDVLRIWF
uniref:Uncharacterized protein n=1 Tax=Arundo donax TaxID=35708 RepID=A0A0A9EIR7_ARUDO